MHFYLCAVDMYTYTHNVPLVGSLKLQVSFAKEPYKRDNILQKRPIILRSGRHVYLYIQCKMDDMQRTVSPKEIQQWQDHHSQIACDLCTHFGSFRLLEVSDTG